MIVQNNMQEATLSCKEEILCNPEWAMYHARSNTRIHED